MNTLTNEYPNIQYILFSTNYNTTACRWSMAASMGHFKVIGSPKWRSTDHRDQGGGCMHVHVPVVVAERASARKVQLTQWVEGDGWIW